MTEPGTPALEATVVSVPVGVFLLDDHEVVRRGLRELIESAASVVGKSAAAPEAAGIRAVQSGTATRATRLPAGSGIDARRETQSSNPAVGFVLLGYLAGNSYAAVRHTVGTATAIVVARVRTTGERTL